MSQMCSYNQIIKDFLTGRDLQDTDDEQIRQKMERFLVEQKGFAPGDIEVDRCFDILVGGKLEKGRAELVVYAQGRPFMTWKCSRGSLVTRERESLAASRLALEVQVPLTVVTNGQDAEIIDTLTSQIVAEGLAAVPDKTEACSRSADLTYLPLPDKKREKEGRIYLAYAAFQCPTDCR